MTDYRRYDVWSAAHGLTLAVYRATACWPSHERYGLTSQLRRSTVSIASNIAEGLGRATTGERARFMSIAMGSASEADYQLLLAGDLGYLAEGDYRSLKSDVNRVRQMLTRLNQTLRRAKREKRTA